MNISFAKNPETSGTTVAEPTRPAESIPSCSALVPQVPAVATAPPQFFDDNNIGYEDLIVPRINLVQKVGDLSLVFQAGEIVLNQTTCIHVPENKGKGIAGSGPLVITPIGFKKTQFVEKVSGGGKGLFVNTEQEVVAAGGTLEYREWEASKNTANPKKRFERYATLLLLVRQPIALLPDAEHQIFPHCIDGAHYVLCLMGLKSTAYTGMAKRLFTERKIGFLKAGGYPSFSWNLTTDIKSFPGADGGTNYAAVPILSPGPKSSPALLEYVRESLGFGN